MTSSRVWRRKRVYLAWSVLHFFLLFTVSARETLWLVARGLTILPSVCNDYSEKLERVGAAVLGLHSAKSNRLRRGLVTYLSFAGIDADYGYFAPNVPNSYKLTFELHYPDGHTEIQIPIAKSGAVDLRLASLLDQIGHTPSDAFREYMIKKLAAVIWREHPNAATMRASFSQTVQPSPDDYQNWKKETDELSCTHTISVLLRI